MKQVEIFVPCGKSKLCARIPAENLLGVYHSQLPPAAADEGAAADAALDHPIASPRLEELAAGKRSAVIIASDHTRPVPSRILMPRLLERLRRGSPDIDVTILIATGCHRSATRAELEAKFGAEIVSREKIVVHDCDDESMLVHLGTLPSGGELVVNRLAVEADLLIAEGFIEPHFFAGFSGGRKSVLPGIASRRTVLANHCAEFISSPFARAGILDGNPIHRDMLFAAKRANLRFILNVVIDGNKKIVHAVAGDTELAHAAGCGFLRSRCGVAVPEADIVVTSNGGYPLDQNIYQAVKGMTAGEAVCRPGGVIVMAAECADGHGGEAFFQMFRDAASPEKLLESICATPQERTVPDQWQAQILARILATHRVVMVTGSEKALLLIRAMHIEAEPTLEAAMARAFSICGENARTAVIPDGVAVVASRADA